MKVFISYATEDRTVAGTLYEEMAAAGAVVFQFGRSQTAGKSSWEEILDWIRDCDVFILLVSKSSAKSRAVKEEVSCAYHSYINTDEKHPSKLIPAIIEHGVDPPLIKHFTHFDLTAITTGVPRLLTQLGLVKKVLAAPVTGLNHASLPDRSEIFLRYATKNPTPSIESQWSEKAEKIVSNYHLLKPKEITPSLGSSHLTNILRTLFGKDSKSSDVNPFAQYDGLFLGLPAASTATDETSRTTTKLSDLLLSYDPNQPFPSSPLPAPKIGATNEGFKWEPVAGASGYAVEESTPKNFASPKEVYRGTTTSYGTAPWADAAYYRVKALGGVFRLDSAWSKVIRKKPTMYVTPLSEYIAPPSASPFNLSAWIPTKLAAPQLQLKPFVAGPTLEWTKVEGALRYVLERSDTDFGPGTRVIYEGDQTSWVDIEIPSAPGSPSRTENPILAQLRLTDKPKPNPLLTYAESATPNSASVPHGMYERPPTTSYRVKAKAPLGKLDSDWSNVVTDPLAGLLTSNKK